MFVVHDGDARHAAGVGRLPARRDARAAARARAELGIATRKRDVPIDALADADEAFLTSTTREVQPIAHVDGVALPAAPGPVSDRASPPRSPTLVARDLDP